MAFSLDLPSKEKVKEEVEKELKLPSKEETELSEAAKVKADEIMMANLDSFEKRKEFTDVIEAFGVADMKAAQTKNAILQKRIGKMEAVGGETASVAKGLEELSLKMKSLDPSSVDFAKKGLLGKITNPVQRYFEKYNSAEDEINTIVESLSAGKGNLLADNATLEREEANMREMTTKMAKNIELGRQLDAYLTQAIENERAKFGDEDKIRFVEEEILYPLRQRIEDFQQIQLVDQQGIISMEMIRRNNNELIRSVDRAQNVTVTALRTAVTVAGALYNQRIVLDKINMINSSTNQMISATSKMLHQQGTEIQKQASESAISVDTMKGAFEEALLAYEEIGRYKQEALPQMKETIEEFNRLATEGEKRIEAMEKSGLF